MITETPSLQKQVQPEGRFVNLIKQEFIKHAKEINRLEKDVDYKYYTKDEVDMAISEALADLISSSADVIETLEDITETIDSKLDKGSPDYVKEVVVDGQNIVVTTGDNKTSIKQVQIPDVPTKTSDLINDSGYISKVYWGDVINKPTIPTIPKNVSAFNNDSGYITEVSWDEVTDKPEFATVATSGSYLDLSNTPTIPTKVSDLTNDTGYITGVSWNEVTGKPNFATVATSGSYADLSNKPTIPTVPTNVSAFNNDSGYITGVAWNDITNKPSTFPPSTHTHDYLPLSGGTMTGSIMFTGANDRGAGVDLNNNGTNFDIGWNWTNRDGAGFYLRSTDFSATNGGGFGAYARNATNSYDLFGNPSGSLTWNGTSFTVGGGTGTITGNITGNVLTGYTKPSTTSALAATDTLNGALGKLEKALDGKSSSSHNHNSHYPIVDNVGLTELTSSNDVNDIVTAGTYWWSSDSGHSKPTNAPCNYGKMIVHYLLGTNWILQKVYPHNSLSFYMRYKTSGTSVTWSDWVRPAYTNSSITGNAATATTANALNNLYTVSTRPTSANKCYADGKLRTYLATSKMTTGKPPSDAQILHLAWDNSKYDSQIAVSTGSNGDLYWRTQKGSDTWGAWQTAAKSGHTHNYAGSSSAGGAATKVAMQEGAADRTRYIYFSSDNSNNLGSTCYNSKFQYNPSTDNLTVGKINGVAVGSSPKFTDTTYSSMSATEATTGTATTARVITAKVLHDKIKAMVNQAMTKNNLTKI